MLMAGSVLMAQNGMGIWVSGTALEQTASSNMIIRLGVETEYSNVKDAFHVNSQRMTEVLKFLKAEKNVDKIQTEHVRMYQSNNYKQDRVYKVSQQITFCLKDFADYERIVTKLVDLGVNSISDIQFEAETDAATKENLKREALRDARAQAEIIAKEMGVTLGKVVYVEESYVSPVELRSKYATMEDHSIEPGTVNQSVKYRVCFSIAD